MPASPAVISAAKAVSRGLLFVYGIVVPLLFLTALPSMLAAALLRDDPGPITVAVVMVLTLAIWCGAWAAWSVLVPRWRLWAYRRVDDLDELKRQAAAAGLIWAENNPVGRLFARTEIVPKSLRRELERLEHEHRPRKSGAP
jgi:hypothetical protein